jgi:EAL domain-containing protein (putative c-di-GMP-specific phosphodiesterase class I)
LKIDQSFIKDLTVDADAAAIVVAVISLAHSLRLQVIAEGVETAEQLAFLRAHGCDQIQGHYFSRPIGANAFESMLQQGSCLPQLTEPCALA